MRMEIELEDYSREKGIGLKWENGFCIEVKAEDGAVLLSANKEGLISLANHLLALSQDEAPAGTHIHLDEYNSLEEGSDELIIEKVV
ncbi:MAG: hypothetical protein NC517_06255 [Firmicutes bacterium]|nr:hypothetical protein [Bacillota bacterium]